MIERLEMKLTLITVVALIFPGFSFVLLLLIWLLPWSRRSFQATMTMRDFMTPHCLKITKNVAFEVCAFFTNFLSY